jgi:prepilin-type N-terminal cleavage/methylation domain-containing protein
MKKKGFTLVELLVVIAIIALLMSILMPALSKERQIAYRIVCGSNLTGIGKSMLVYSQDNYEQFPVAGRANAQWNGKDTVITNYQGADRTAAFSATHASVSSCFYLLIKYADVQSKQFICKGDEGSVPFIIPSTATTGKELVDLWDFGPSNLQTNPAKAVSYSYHYPLMFRNSAITTGNLKYNITAGSMGHAPLCSDRNPYLDINAKDYRDGQKTGEDAPDYPDNAYVDQHKTGNAAAHQRDGQNVLFQHTHVDFAKYPNVGINNDNIFKQRKTGTDEPKNREVGADITTTDMTTTNAAPQHKEDCVMISELND